MRTKDDRSALGARLVAGVLIGVLVLLGVIGLVLPIIPGLLLLVVAAWLGARHFPWLERRLRRSRSLGVYLDRADGFVGLTPLNKLKVGGLICLKILIDGLVLAGSAATKLLRGGTGALRRSG